MWLASLPFIATNERETPMRFGRITTNPAQMGGVPCIRGLRVPVAMIVGLLAQGMSRAQVLADYPDLEPEDIEEALRYAAASTAAAVDERQLPLVTSVRSFS